jgi:hypothetical protein
MDERHLPKPLVCVGTFLMLVGVMSLCNVLYLAAIGQGQVSTIFALLGSAWIIVAAWRLLHRISGAWGTALTLTGVLSGASLLAILFILSSRKPMPVELVYGPTITLPTPVAAVPFILLFLLSLWSSYVLIRPEVRELF